MAAAAFATSPLCQAVRNRVDSAVTSAADGGPVFTALRAAVSDVRSSADAPPPYRL